jgi:hypothetical protein
MRPLSSPFFTAGAQLRSGVLSRQVHHRCPATQAESQLGTTVRSLQGLLMHPWEMFLCFQFIQVTKEGQALLLPLQASSKEILGPASLSFSITLRCSSRPGMADVLRAPYVQSCNGPLV